MQFFQSKTVLITGGANGIGKRMAKLVLQEGGDVIIWDIQSNLLEETINEFQSLGKISGLVVDVSDPKSIEKAVQETHQLTKKIDVLINNAGIVVGGYFSENHPNDVLRTMSINATAVMLITQHFLPQMIAKNSGIICNIASSAGLVANPKMAVYAGSKWAVVGWSESLRLELKQQQSKVQVTTILPYYINTGMFDGVQSRIPILNADVAATSILKAIRKKKKMVTLPGYIYRMTRISQGLLSLNAFDFVAGKVLGIYKTMDHFKGRPNTSKNPNIPV